MKRIDYSSLKTRIGILIFSISLVSLNCQNIKTRDAEEFDEIARTVFKNIYPFLAQQIKEDFSITRGICIDAGAGGGYLSIELAKITDMEIYALDIDPGAIKIAQRNIDKAQLSKKIKTVQGDVQKMPFSENFADLVVSRGSFPFWEDKVKAFKDIYRVLKPGGVAFIGGGMGRLLPLEEREKISKIMEKEKIGPPENLAVTVKEMGEILRKAGIPRFEVSTDEGCPCGLWVNFQKPSLATADNSKEKSL